MSQVSTKADDQAIVEAKEMASADASATKADDQDYMTTGMGKAVCVSESTKELDELDEALATFNYIHPITGKNITLNQFIDLGTKLGKLNVKAKTIDDMRHQLMALDKDEQDSWVRYLHEPLNQSVHIPQLFDTWKRNTYGGFITYDPQTGEYPEVSIC